MFDYPPPPLWELREMYETPYRFSEGVQESAHRLFAHPHNKWSAVYERWHKESDANDMCKVAYLIIRYAMEHDAQFGGAVENCMDAVLVRMWKNFLGLNKGLRGASYGRYLPTPMKQLTLAQGGFLELMMTEIETHGWTSNDDMVKVRQDVGLRERREMKYSEADLRYYEGL